MNTLYNQLANLIGLLPIKKKKAPPHFWRGAEVLKDYSKL